MASDPSVRDAAVAAFQQTLLFNPDVVVAYSRLLKLQKLKETLSKRTSSAEIHFPDCRCAECMNYN